jgi:AcrR family transcriptional regulator
MVQKKCTSAERHQQIVEKAAQFFSENGFEGSKTRHLATACGVNESLLFQHFANKEELYIEAMRFLYKPIIEEYRNIAASKPNGYEAIKEIVITRITSLYSSPILALNALHNLATSHKIDEIRNISSTLYLQIYALLCDQITRGKLDKSINASVQPEEVVSILMGFAAFVQIVVVLGIQENIQKDQILNYLDKYLNSIACDTRQDV